MSEEEFMALYNEVHGRLFTFAVKRVPVHSAEDIVSQTFVTIWEKRDDCPAELGAQVGWALTICRYKVMQELDRLRRKHHDNRFIVDGDGFGSKDGDIAEIVSNRAVWGSVYLRLTALDRELFDVAWIRGLNRAEGANVLSIAVGTFDTRVSRLRSKIRDLFEEAAKAESDTAGGVS